MKIKVTLLFPFPLYCMGGRTKIEDSEKKKDLRNPILCVAQRSCDFFLFL
jgi:hypothetical protein